MIIEAIRAASVIHIAGPYEVLRSSYGGSTSWVFRIENKTMSRMNATSTTSVIKPEANVPKVAPTLEHSPINANPNVIHPRKAPFHELGFEYPSSAQNIPIGWSISPLVIPCKLDSFTVGSLRRFVSMPSTSQATDTNFTPVPDQSAGE